MIEFYQYLLLLSGILIYVGIYLYLYYWLNRYSNHCECLNIWYVKYILIYILINLIHFVLVLIYFTIFNEVLTILNDILVIYQIISIPIMILLIKHINDKCACYNHISTEIMKVILVIMLIMNTILIVSYINKIIRVYI
jgi:hypothetical protein